MMILLLNVIIKLYTVTYSINFFSTLDLLTSFIQLTGNNQQIFTTCLIPFIITSVLLLSFFVRNPIYTLLLTLFSFILYNILIINISSELIVYIFLTVYLGVVMMLFNLSNLKNYKKSNSVYIIIFVLFVLLFFFDMQKTILLFNNVKLFFDINFFFKLDLLTSFIQFTDNSKQLFTTYSIPYIYIKVIIFFVIPSVSISIVLSAFIIVIFYNSYLTEKNFIYCKITYFKKKIFMICKYIILKKKLMKEKFNYYILFKNNIFLGAIFFPKKENNYTSPKYETYNFPLPNTFIPPRHPSFIDDFMPFYAIIFFLIMIFFFRCWENRDFIYYNRFYDKPYTIRFTKWYNWRKNHILFLLKFLEIRVHIVFKPIVFFFNKIRLYMIKIWQKFDSWIINFLLLLSFIYYIVCFLFFLPFIVIYFLLISFLIKFMRLVYYKIYKKLINFYIKKFKSK